MLKTVISVAAAFVTCFALAPPPPSVLSDRDQPMISRAPSGYDANLKWNAVPGAAAYRIFWREAWGPDWQHEVLVGNVTNLVLIGSSALVNGVAVVNLSSENERLFDDIARDGFIEENDIPSQAQPANGT